MKCFITGHTKGIGQALFLAFKEQGHDVNGVSRGTGIDMSADYQAVVKQALECDLVINNAYHTDHQCKLLEDLNGKVKNIISIGSVAGYYTDILSKKHYYSAHKKSLLDLNKRLSYTSSSNLLLINVGLAENASPDPGCTYDDIVRACIFWLSMPNINQIDFKINLSKINTDLIEADFGIKLSDYPDKF